MESILFGVSLTTITVVQTSKFTVALPNTRTWNGRFVKAVLDKVRVKARARVGVRVRARVRV